MAHPECEFHFEILDERPSPEGLDDRLFRLSEIAPGSVTRIVSSLDDLGPPTTPAWTPIWDFSSEASRVAAERKIDEVVSVRRPTNLVIRTPDMKRFLGRWDVDDLEGGDNDWFADLGL